MKQPWSSVLDGIEKAELFQTQRAYGLQRELKSFGIHLFKLHSTFWQLHMSLFKLL